MKRFEIKKTGSNVAGDSDGTESDYETSSTSFPGSNEWLVSICSKGGRGTINKSNMIRRGHFYQQCSHLHFYDHI